MSRGPYRRHSVQFKLQLCHDARAGTVGRKSAQRKYALSANLVHLWLTQYDNATQIGPHHERHLRQPDQTRLAAAFLAVITSAVALGGTVAGFQPASGTTLVVFDRVTVRAAAAN